MTLRLALLAVPLLLAAMTAPGNAAAQQDRDSLEVFVELRVWQGVDDLEDIWVSARPRGGDWDTLGTIPFTLDNEYPVYHDWRYYRYSDLVVAGATLRIWQWTGDLERISVCAHRCGDPWSRSVPLPLGALPLPLEDGHSPDGHYRYGDLKIATAPGHPLLLADRVQLLRLRDTLAGTGALDWDHDTPMTTWTGVTIGGTVLRVRKLNLAGSGLTGELSGLLGNLTGLEELRLDGNALTGAIPSKLSQLGRLTHAYLGGNALTRCVPSSLRAVPNNDLAPLGLPDCLPPIELYGDADTILTDGSYMIRSSWISEGRSRFVFDVPAGIRMTMRGPYKVYGHDYPAWLLLDHVDSRSVTGFSLGYGSEYHRTADPAAPGIPAAFDRIIESAWFAQEETPSTGRPELTAVAGGRAGEILLEWTIAKAGATHWQYRQKGPGEQDAWEDWTDVPGSDANTTSHRLTGLQLEQPYAFEVRRWTATGAGDAYDAAEAVALRAGADSIPIALPNVALEEGRTFRVGETVYTFTVPAGWPLALGEVKDTSDGSTRIRWEEHGRSNYVIYDARLGLYVDGARMYEWGPSFRQLRDTIRESPPSMGTGSTGPTAPAVAIVVLGLVALAVARWRGRV